MALFICQDDAPLNLVLSGIDQMDKSTYEKSRNRVPPWSCKMRHTGMYFEHEQAAQHVLHVHESPGQL